MKELSKGLQGLEMPDFEIKARKNGPYKIMGTFTYIDEHGQKKTTSGSNIALCRCGHSVTKPFCDGKHREVGFTASLVYMHVIEEK